MNRLLKLLLRLTNLSPAAVARLSVILAWALFASACGPGTGGTGVGPVTGVYVSTGVTGTAASTVGLPSTITAAGANVLLLLSATDLRVDSLCWVFTFQGNWVEHDGEVRIQGSYQSSPSGADLSPVLATSATLVARSDSAGLLITLIDENGGSLVSFAPATRLGDEVYPPALPATCQAAKLLRQ